MIFEQLQNLQSNERLWIYIPENKKNEFKKELFDLQVTWNDQERFQEKDNISNFIAVHKDLRIANISIICWKASFQMNFADQTKVKHVHYPDGKVIQSLYEKKN